MSQMEDCEFCGLPAIGVCPRCQRKYCPDHVQPVDPYLLCFNCSQEQPDYLTRWGAWKKDGVWEDYRSGISYQLHSYRLGVKINSSRDLWAVIEKIFADPDTGQGFWDKAEILYLNAGNPQGATVCWLRGKGVFNRDDCIDVVSKLANQDKADEAFEIIERYLSLFPDHADVISVRASIYFWKKRFLDAIEDYSTIIHLYPNHPLAYEGRINANYSMPNKNYSAIEQDLLTLERLNAMSAQMLLTRGLIHARQVILFGRKEFAQKVRDDFQQLTDLNTRNSIDSSYLLQVSGLVDLLSDKEKEGQEELYKAVQLLGPNVYYDLLFLL
jgi:tetratricopeptide (TPR) repeat protein